MGTIGHSIWIGEFGWECQWQAYLRKLSPEYDRMIISTFPGMEALYQGFHCPVEFYPHEETGRALDWRDVSHVRTGVDVTQYTKKVERITPLKQYRLEGEHIRYGTPRETGIEVLLHARGVPKSTFKNYPQAHWTNVAAAFPKCASVGTMDDLHVEGTEDKRGIPLQELMDLIASAQLIIGQSSGVMHLATLCGTRQVVWADDKTYFGEKLEQRYKETWNPFKTPVSWVYSNNWCPEPDEIIKAVISGGEGNRPTNNILSKLKEAVESRRYAVSIAYIGEKDGKDVTTTFVETVNLPIGLLPSAFEQMKSNMDEIIEKEGIKTKEVTGIWR